MISTWLFPLKEPEICLIEETATHSFSGPWNEPKEYSSVLSARLTSLERESSESGRVFYWVLKRETSNRICVHWRGFTRLAGTTWARESKNGPVRIGKANNPGAAQSTKRNTLKMHIRYWQSRRPWESPWHWDHSGKPERLEFGVNEQWQPHCLACLHSRKERRQGGDIDFFLRQLHPRCSSQKAGLPSPWVFSGSTRTDTLRGAFPWWLQIQSCWQWKSWGGVNTIHTHTQ